MSGAEEPRKRGLGRGLSALLGDPVVQIVATGEGSDGARDGKELRTLPIEHLYPGKFQPRRVNAPAASLICSSDAPSSRSSLNAGTTIEIFTTQA